jgi:hypothetical protein
MELQMTEKQQEELFENSKLIAKMHALLTGNGSPDTGLVHDVAYIKNNMVGKENCEAFRNSCAEKRAIPTNQRRNTWLVAKDVILVLVAAVTLLVGGGVLLRLR